MTSQEIGQEIQKNRNIMAVCQDMGTRGEHYELYLGDFSDLPVKVMLKWTLKVTLKN